ncbi:MAG: L-threonine 3-dehydrogenase [Euryarchaeota archaeon]|nr:L-threonine 3-dehydrogenase [Euryarchaeota archaeon]
MRAFVKTKAEPGGTELREVPVPEAGPNDVLIKVKVASICGTDVHIYEWDSWAQNRIKAPLVYGHEFAGEVVKVGSNVQHVKAGEFVSGECHIACGHCFNCRNNMQHVCLNTKIFGVDRAGAFAEYISIPENNVWHNDPSLPPELCSIQDPLGNAVHTVFATDFATRDVAVLGIGPIGAMAVSVLKNCGASQVFAIGRKNQYRIDLAKAVGADFALSSNTDDVKGIIMKATNGKGADCIIETAGSVEAVDLGLDVMRSGGTFAMLGVFSKPMTLDLSKKVVFKYATIKGINGRLMYDTWYRMAGLFRIPRFREDMKKIITHRFRFDEFEKAMATMRSGQSGKVVMHLE